MYGDEKIRVETYHDKLKTQMLSVLYIFRVFMHMTQNEAMTSVHRVVPGKAHVEGKNVRNVNILSSNKKIFVARQK